MSRDAFLSEALYEADKVLEKFAAAPLECACLQDVSINSLHLCIRLYTSAL